MDILSLLQVLQNAIGLTQDKTKMIVSKGFAGKKKDLKIKERL